MRIKWESKDKGGKPDPSAASAPVGSKAAAPAKTKAAEGEAKKRIVLDTTSNEATLFKCDRFGKSWDHPMLLMRFDGASEH